MRKRILPVLVLSPLLSLSLSACAAPRTEPAVPGIQPSAAVTQPAAETSVASASPAASQAPTETKALLSTVPAGSQGALAAATADLAARLGIDPQEIQTVEVVAEEWSDASLGCPQPDMLYAQVITPGFRIILKAGDQDYAYHTDRGTRAVLCGPDGAPILPGTPVSPGEA